MATKKEMRLLKHARAGDSDAQLQLGMHYLTGSAGLPKSLLTALHWFDLAAKHGKSEAWNMIGMHIPFEIAVRAPNTLQLCLWYENAFKAGITNAAVVFAKLVFTKDQSDFNFSMRQRAISALEAAAQEGHSEAQLLLMGELGAKGYLTSEHGHSSLSSLTDVTLNDRNMDAALVWAHRAAENGVLQAQRALAAHAWVTGDRTTFVQWAVPVARAIANAERTPRKAAPLDLSKEDIFLLTRCAQALVATANYNTDEVETFWTLAAQAGDRDAQFALGMWMAHMDANGHRTAIEGNRNLGAAVHWLTLAGQQGVVEAWYMLAKIYRKPTPGLASRGWPQIAQYLERAAEAGHCLAQLELGLEAWRTRRGNKQNEIIATYWLQKAAAQGNVEAHNALRKIVTLATPAPWACVALDQMTEDIIRNHPFLVARVELAAMFGLAFPEAMLLDLNTADHGHCLEVDITAIYGRSTRRIVLIQTLGERQLLTRVRRIFANIDCSENGPEGNYRKRYHFFKKTFHFSEEENIAMFRSSRKPLPYINSG